MFGERAGSRMADNGSILVTGAAGQLGAVGRTVTGLLLDRGLPVRAMVRREDDRAAALRVAGAEVVVGDLLEPADVYRVVSGCRRVYFGMSVSAGYLEATVTMATVAREVGVNALVNMSQMTVSQMSIQNTTPSPQQRRSRGPACRSSPSGRRSSWRASSSPSPVRASVTEAASNCRSGGARPLRLPRRMSLG
jgi:NADPH:quinone reductase-like Zn-dependent oxidoreductase